MLIQEWMSSDVLTVESTCSLQEAVEIFQARSPSKLPVVKKGKPVGLLIWGDIQKRQPSDATNSNMFETLRMHGKIKVERIMSKPVVTIRNNYTVPEAARVMLSSGVSSLPVVDRYGVLVGIITKNDIFRCMISFMGVTDNGQIFGFNLMDERGMIKKITDRIREGGGRIGSVMTTYEKDKDGRRKIFIYAFGMEHTAYDLLTEEYRKRGCLLYAADLSSRTRELYL